MCLIRPKSNAASQLAEQPEPEKPAEPTEIGEARVAEDKTLFGDTGAPETRIDRSQTSPTLDRGGSGLKLM